MNELSQMHHPSNKLGTGFKDNNNAKFEKALNGFINDYEVCNLCYTYIYSDTKIQQNVENEQTIFLSLGLQWNHHAIDNRVGNYQ